MWLAVLKAALRSKATIPVAQPSEVVFYQAQWAVATAAVELRLEQNPNWKAGSLFFDRWDIPLGELQRGCSWLSER